ncbi:MAG: T9SS type A sorting domain-containing protein [Bacteroidota bacterium]
MKEKLFRILFCVAFIAGVFFTKNAISQTAGTMTFVVNPVAHPTASYTPKHVAAVWVEYLNGTFVKTRARQGSSSNSNSHLTVWKAKSNSSVVDATAAATLTAYAAQTYTWNANDITGTTPYNLVADGVYKVEIQYAWDDPAGPTTSDTVSVFFTKGPSPVTLSPADVTNFTGMSLTWTPATQNTTATSALASSSYCSGAAVSVAFTNAGTTTVYANNVWTAQLSDASGSFASPVTIGTLSGATVGAISATIPAGTTAGTGYRIRVIGTQPATTGTDNGTNLTISPVPTAPTVGTITQPTCPVPTGSVVLSGLPATGTWTINPGNITGTGTSHTVTGLAAGTYNFTVTAGCASPATTNVVINAAPAGPSAPTVGTITQATCTVITGSVVLNGLPATGTWTIMPGNITGTGTSHTVTGIPVGNHTYTVADATGCYSVASANVFIDPQYTVPSAPVADSIHQPTCLVQTGTVYIGGLPAVGTWTINPGGITGTGTTYVLSGLPSGTYNCTVTNAATCVSAASASIVINAIPSIPPTPTITNNNNVLTSSASAGNQWYKLTTGAISGATNQTYTVTANGSYFVIVTVSGCLSDSSNIATITNVGIESIQNNNQIKVYPNPVSNELIIELVANTSNVNFAILNTIGQEVFKGTMVEKTTVQTSSFAPGVYMIKFENGKTFEFKKVIKK